MANPCPLLRIAILTAHPADAVSGVARCVQGLIQTLGGLGHQVHVIYHDPSASIREDLRTAVQAGWSQILAFRPDVIHVEAVDAMVVGLAREGLARGIPVTLTFHELHRYGDDAEPESIVLQKMIHLHRLVDGSIGRRGGHAALLHAGDVPWVHMAWVGIDLDIFHPQRRRSHHRHGWKAEDHPVILWVGRILAQKRPALFVQACRAARLQYPLATVVVVGDGPDREAMLAELPEAIWYPVLSGVALAEVYASADLFVMPSDKEGYGIVISEALASGLPVVACDCDAYADRLNHGRNCLLSDPADDGAFIRNVVGLVVDHERRRALAAEARPSIMHRGWSTAGEAYAAAFIATIARKRMLERRALPPGHGCPVEQVLNLERDAIAAEMAGDDRAAIEMHRVVLRTRPTLAAAWGNLGTLLARHGDPDAGAHALRRALALAEKDPEIRVNHGLMELTAGRWRSGFAFLSGMLERSKRPPHPLWDGRPVRRLLLYAGVGLGDTVQDLRFVTDAARLAGGMVTVAVQPRLLWWVREALPAFTVTAMSGPMPAADACHPLHLLPRILGTTPAAIPPPIAPLVDAPQPRNDRFLRVGICWRGDARGRVDRGRSLDAAQLAPLAHVPGIRWICLQHHPEDAPPWIEVLPGLDEGPDAFRDSAGVIRGLDLVLTTDTSVAHVAGSLGCPTWLLLQWLPDWRWLRDRSDTPWYPCIRLLRQERPGDWTSLLERVAVLLESLVGSGPDRPFPDEGR